MIRKIWFAVILGVLLGAGVAYRPNSQPSNIPRAQLLMQSQPSTYARSNSAPTYNLIPILIALAAGLLVATPVFLVARKSSK
jgi:hypothetical protein